MNIKSAGYTLKVTDHGREVLLEEAKNGGSYCLKTLYISMPASNFNYSRRTLCNNWSL